MKVINSKNLLDLLLYDYSLYTIEQVNFHVVGLVAIFFQDINFDNINLVFLQIFLDYQVVNRNYFYVDINIFYWIVVILVLRNLVNVLLILHFLSTLSRVNVAFIISS